MKTRWVELLLVTLFASSAFAQSEAALKDYFEGKTVVVKLDMPGADDGVDVFPGEPRAIDFSRHGERLKEFGAALRAGDSALVTKVRVKKDIIEFQLNGGGYGTFGDDTSTSTYIPSAKKSRREEDLDQAIKHETDRNERKRLERERDRLRNDRSERDAQNQATAAATKAIKEQSIIEKRLRGGSRFNVRYRNGMPGAVLLPEGLMTVLADFVDFGPVARGASVGSRALVAAPAGSAGAGKSDLKVGMTPLEVIDLLGKPQKEVSFEKTTRWTYPDMTLVFENGRLKEVKF